MTQALTPFAFEDALVRVSTDEHGEPWFVAKDVGNVLGLQNIRQNLGELEDDEKGVSIADTLGGSQQVTTISESGLYALIFRSRKSEARRFRKWVTSEVLPTIRKTGQFTLSPPGLPAAAPQAIQMDLPPPPEEAMHLHPSMRQRLWQDALQTARLDNAGSDVALHWFAYLCRMVAQRPTSTFDEVRAFFAECCIPAPGNREKAGVLYEAFRAWRRHVKNPMPSIKAFGQSMSLFAHSKKSSGIVYCDIALKK